MKDYKDMARDVLRRRDEYLKEKKRKQRMVLGISASVVCLFLAVATPFVVMKLNAYNSKIPNSLPQDNSEVPEIPAANGDNTEIKENPAADTIIYPGTSSSEIKTEIENDVLYVPVDGKTVYFDHNLNEVLKTASDTDRIAFAVKVYGEEVVGADEFSELSAKVNEKDEKLGNTANSDIERLMAQCGISYAEAAARKFTEGEFPLVRAELWAAKREYAEARARSYFEKNSQLFDATADFGFEVLYTGADEDYAIYLNRITALGVLVGTKAQIEAFAESVTDVHYYLVGSIANAEAMNPTDFYTGSEVYLEDGSGLSAAVLEQFSALGDSEKLKVKVEYAYFGKEYQSKEEIGQAALDAIGLDMTFFEWYNSNDNELYEKYLDKYTEAKNRIIYHKDFNEQVVSELLYDGELVEIRDWSNCFIAELSYERALEIAQSEDVAYIDTEVNVYLKQNIAVDDIVDAELE